MSKHIKCLATKIERLEQGILIDQWRYPVGIAVDVTEDDGRTTRTVTRSEPWLVSNRAVILLQDRSGGFLLERCTALSLSALPT